MRISSYRCFVTMWLFTKENSRDVRRHIKLQRLKPRPHQQQCRSNIVECYKSNDSFDKVETYVEFALTLSKGQNCTKKSRSTLLPKTATMSKQRSTLLKKSFDLQHSTMLL